MAIVTRFFNCDHAIYISNLDTFENQWKHQQDLERHWQTCETEQESKDANEYWSNYAK